MSSPSSPLFLLLFLLLFLFPSTLSQEQFRCRDAFSFSTSGIARAAELTHCRKLPALGVELGWKLHNRTTDNITAVDIVFSAVTHGTNGWVAWGVNPGPGPQMVGTRALVGIRQTDGGDGAQPGPPLVATYNVTQSVQLGCQLRNSSVEFAVENVWSGYSAATGRMAVAARLLLPPEYDASRLNHVWQVGPATAGMALIPHYKSLENFDGVETLDLVTGQGVGRRNTNLRYAHGALNTVGWGILMPTGIIITRYFSEFPFKHRHWLLLHSCCQASAYVMGVTAWGIGLALVGRTKYYTTFMGHRIVGILIFCLATMQILAIWLKPARSDKYRRYWCMYHHFLGYSLLALTIVNIFKGFNILKPPPVWREIYIGILCIVGCLVLALESMSWYKFFRGLEEECIALK